MVVTNINLGGGGSEGEYKRGEDLAGARDDADHGVIQLHEVTEDADGEKCTWGQIHFILLEFYGNCVEDGIDIDK